MWSGEGRTAGHEGAYLRTTPAFAGVTACWGRQLKPRGAGETTFDQVDTVPEQLRGRMLAVRAFDGDGMMIGFELSKGAVVEAVIERLLADDRAAYLHIHFAAPGCYAAKVLRA